MFLCPCPLPGRGATGCAHSPFQGLLPVTSLTKGSRRICPWDTSLLSALLCVLDVSLPSISYSPRPSPVSLPVAYCLHLFTHPHPTCGEPSGRSRCHKSCH